MSIKPSRSAERGIGLAEHLVAVAVFALATAIALSQLDAARSAIKLGSNRAELQQSLRAAADRLVYDLRLAGLDADPDESIVLAGSTALVIRAAAEIVGYMLAKPGSASEGAFSFETHTGAASVSHVALTHDDPPYTLYRITLKPGTNRVARTPVIDNVRSLRFAYRDDDDGRVPCDSCAHDDEALRRSIRHIRVDLAGQTRDPDPSWIDSFDPQPTSRHHRKLALTLDVKPRNLGLPQMVAE